MIPYGVLANGSGIVLGGILGCLIARFIPQSLLKTLPSVLGLSALGIGIVNVVKLDNMIVVMLSLILGSIIGELSALERRAITLIDRLGSLCKEENRSLFLSLVVLFSMSGTGIFGAMQAGINNDHSILYAKAILDFFTAFSFATSLGLMIASIAIPQMAIQAVLFILAITFLGTLPHHMVANFQATGGLITFAIGLNILKIKELHILNYTPALLLAFPLSYVGTLVV